MLLQKALKETSLQRSRVLDIYFWCKLGILHKGNLKFYLTLHTKSGKWRSMIQLPSFCHAAAPLKF